MSGMDKDTALTALAHSVTIERLCALLESYELGMIDAETFAARAGDLIVDLNRRLRGARSPST